MTTERVTRSLRTELLASLAMVLVLAVVSLSLAAELLGRRRHRQLEVERAREHAASLAAVAGMRLGGPASGPGALDDLLQQALASSRGTIAIELFSWSERGDPVALASAGIPGATAPTLEPKAAVHGGALDDAGILVIDEPIPTFTGPSRVALLRVSSEIPPWSGSADWTAISIVAGGVTFVLLVLGGMLVQAQVVRPLRELEAGVAAVARGELETRVELRGSREFEELSQGFNEMTAALGTQRQVLERQSTKLQRSEHMAAVGRLSAGVAHEVGNPLAALLGYTELLLDPRAPTPLNEEQRELLERVRSQTSRIQNIVGQLLDYSRQRERKVESIELRAVTRETLELLGNHPAAEGVELELLEGSEVRAWADRELVAQVLLNLGINACLAARDGDGPARVRVAVDDRESRALIEVRDSGPGVGDELRERIFEPFFTTRSAGAGTGLGLAISRSIVESMDGNLECAPDRSLLGGACFVLALPTSARPRGEHPAAS